MPTWRNTSIDSLKAAQELHRSGRARSAVSRAYFSAYGAVVSRLPESMTSAGGRDNPSHAKIRNLITHNLTPDLTESKTRSIARSINTLQINRLAADYDPGATVDTQTSLDSVLLATEVLKLLEIIYMVAHLKEHVADLVKRYLHDNSRKGTTPVRVVSEDVRLADSAEEWWWVPVVFDGDPYMRYVYYLLFNDVMEQIEEKEHLTVSLIPCPTPHTDEEPTSSN